MKNRVRMRVSEEGRCGDVRICGCADGAFGGEKGCADLLKRCVDGAFGGENGCADGVKKP